MENIKKITAQMITDDQANDAVGGREIDIPAKYKKCETEGCNNRVPIGCSRKYCFACLNKETEKDGYYRYR